MRNVSKRYCMEGMQENKVLDLFTWNMIIFNNINLGNLFKTQ